jgi:hypothetical protein
MKLFLFGICLTLLGIPLLRVNFYLGLVVVMAGALMAVVYQNQAMKLLIQKVSGKLTAKSAPPSSRSDATQSTSATNPYVIRNPSLGLLNLMGDNGSVLFNKDIEDIGSSFPKNVNVGIGQVPKCNVLFVYCVLEPSGRIAGQSFSLRDVIKAAGAHIAVVASENSPDVLTSSEFGQFLNTKGNWPANIIITVNRNGDTFGEFFKKLFTQMHAGITMPLAWVNLAPQGPSGHADCPGTIALLEAGHVTFHPA